MAIVKQDFPDLARHAGDAATATGELCDGATFLIKLE